MVWHIWSVVFACILRLPEAGDLVGPDAVGSYQGGGGGRRHGGYVRVQDPSVGFYVGGSSIREMNGLYGRVNSIPATLELEASLAYKHDLNGWLLALVKASLEVQRATRRQTEWVLIDQDGATRFRHDGDTLIPGSGHRWSHVHRTASAEPDPNAGTKVSVATEDDEEELPWQVVGIGGEDMLQKLRQYFRFYRHNVQQAIDGHGLPPLPHIPWGGSKEQAPPADFKLPEIPGVDWDDDDVSALSEFLAGGVRSHNAWTQAVLHLEMAKRHRRRREIDKAEASSQAALAQYPRYRDALLEVGLCHMDAGKYVEAISDFEVVLRLDRAFTPILDWLVRAHAHAVRQQEAPSQRAADKLEAHETQYCVAWRQTGGCDAAGPREDGHDRACDAIVPRGSSGFCECKGLIGSAGESTCDHEAFTCRDLCSAKFRSLALPADEWEREKLRLQAERTQEATKDPCSTVGGRSPPDWCSPNHYLALGVRCDLPVPEDGAEVEELKRAYKRLSLQVHPDKRGGSTQAFQRVALAYEVLSVPEKRTAFDAGEELKREENSDGTEGPPHKEKIERHYFPERFGFEPFGDTHSDRKEQKAREARRLERRRQDALARGEKSGKTEL